MMLAVRVEAVTLASGGLALLNGGMAAAAGERVEHVQVYKNGGVGALGNMGTQEASVRAESWAWLTLTRDPTQLTCYLNGHVASVVQLKALEQAEMTGLHPHPILPCADAASKKRRACSVCALPCTFSKG